MSVSAVASKNAPVIAPIIGAALALHSDTIITVGAVVIGLFFGALWRTGSLLSERRPFKDIRTDWFISITIGGANAILTLALVEWLELNPLLTMGMGAVIGATGLRALPEIKDALMNMAARRLIGDNVTVMRTPLVPDDALREEMRDAGQALDASQDGGE